MVGNPVTGSKASGISPERSEPPDVLIGYAPDPTDALQERGLLDVVRCSAMDQLAALRERIAEGYTHTGALLIRGMSELASADDPSIAATLNKVLGVVSETEEPDIKTSYFGGVTPRSKKGADTLFSSTEIGQRSQIGQHNELAYAYCSPRHLALVAKVTPRKGGQTPFTRNLDVTARLMESAIPELLERGLVFHRVVVQRSESMDIVDKCYNRLIPFRHQVFGDASDEDIEQQLRQDPGLVYLEKDSQGNFRYGAKRPALVESHKSEKTYYAQIQTLCNKQQLFDGRARIVVDSKELQAMTNRYSDEELFEICRKRLFIGSYTHDDGSTLSPELVREIEAAVQNSTFCFDWEEGDILILDNQRFMHGRNKYRGNRDIRVSMAGNFFNWGESA